MGMSPAYCRKTPISKMGFSQISSCKAQGIIPRSGRRNRGKRVVSPKYKKSIKRSARKRYSMSPKDSKRPTISPSKFPIGYKHLTYTSGGCLFYHTVVRKPGGKKGWRAEPCKKKSVKRSPKRR